MFYELDHPIVSDYRFFGSDENFEFPTHIHYNYEIIVVEDGEMAVSVGDEEYLLRRGEAVIVFPNQIHSMRTPQKSRHRLIVFDPGLVSAYTQRTEGTFPRYSKFLLPPHLFEMFCRLNMNTDILTLKGTLYLICASFHESAEYSVTDKALNNLTFKIFRYIQENYSGECTLAGLALEMGYDYSYLSRYFKRVIGISFNEYVNQVRVSHACYLMSNSDMNMIEISSECGFRSVRSMNRNFKDITGGTPSEYRKQTLA
ncbi:MAG: helix-turn-helix transcriptional regulator [Clostridia bacterium]|nr:helix-turn-helix transcriptional regulator [Clostridia bacterium]